MSDKLSVGKSTLLIFLWFIIAIAIIVSAFSTHTMQENHVESLALHRAKVNLEKDTATRLWVASQGGVYVPLTEKLQANQYLDVPERDITFPNGKQFTLMNPAYMMRKLMEAYYDRTKIRGRLVSLNPINPINIPNQWEAEQLRRFEQEYTVDAYRIFKDQKSGNKMLEYLKPLVTKESCLKCHEHQGYKVGDIRGGIGVHLNMDKIDLTEHRNTFSMILIHIIFLILITFFIVILLHRIKVNDIEQQRITRGFRELKSSKELFVTTINHELRTPLNVILGMCSILKDEVSKKEHRSALKKIERSGTDLKYNLENALKLSQIYNNKITTNSEIFDLEELYLSITKKFLNYNRKETITFKSVYNITHSYRKGDASKIKSILTNILHNAFKFSNKGEVRLTISEVHKNPNVIEFIISDQGIGIPRDQQCQIFRYFERLQPTKKHIYRGIGLGLSVSCEFARLLGAELELISKENIGSTFSFKLHLPRRDQPSPKHHEAVDKSLNTAKILLAEDDENTIAFMKMLLNDPKIHLTIANNGKSATEKVCAEKFDLALFDLQMPVMDGKEAVETIRKFEKRNAKDKTPIIIVSAFAYIDEIKECEEAGCDGYLPKPVKIADLKKVIKKHAGIDLFAKKKQS